jgi:hypothetical protein
MVASAGSAGIAAYSAYQQGQAQKQQAQANQDISRAQTADALQRGAEGAGDARSQGTQVLGAQRAATAANGVSLDSTGSRNLFDSTQTNSEYDAGLARANAAREAWGHQVETENFRLQKDYARRSSVLGPLAAVIGGASRIAGFGYQATG